MFLWAALAEVEALAFDVAAHGGMFGVGWCAIAQRHTFGGFCEADVEEYAEVTRGAEFGACKKMPSTTSTAARSAVSISGYNTSSVSWL